MEIVTNHYLFTFLFLDLQRDEDTYISNLQNLKKKMRRARENERETSGQEETYVGNKTKTPRSNQEE